MLCVKKAQENPGSVGATGCSELRSDSSRGEQEAEEQPGEHCRTRAVVSSTAGRGRQGVQHSAESRVRTAHRHLHWGFLRTVTAETKLSTEGIEYKGHCKVFSCHSSQVSGQERWRSWKSLQGNVSAQNKDSMVEIHLWSRANTGQC